MRQEAKAQGQEGERHETSFWDTFPAMVFLVLAIIFARWYILEPFKIPSGSMEPTLFGHEDHGDRIVTNKLAYVGPAQVWLVLGVSAALIAFGFAASKGWRSVRAIVTTVLIAAAVLGGTLLAWARDAVAGQPQRFDVVVFQYNTEWLGSRESAKDINYIKRLIGLPHEELVVSGGDLYLHKSGKDEIIRKWQERPEMQETVWYPVSKAWTRVLHERPKETDPHCALIRQQLEALRFPWKGAEPGTPGVVQTARSLALDGAAPVTLTYAYEVTNIYLKQGRWPFTHSGCPAARLPELQAEGGVTFRNPASKTEDITAYVQNTWEGVQCPNCKQVVFPLAASRPGSTPELRPGPAKFFYGGDCIVGDLKLELEVSVETAGSLELEVGSDAHRAWWKIPSDNAGAETAPGVHLVQAAGSAPQLAPGKHTLSLAYVDATVIAVLDGHKVSCQLIDVPPPGRAAEKTTSTVRASFSGFKGTLTRLDLFRDLYYTPALRGTGLSERAVQGGSYIDRATGNYCRKLRRDEYLMLGDNSPSSADGRVWGHVPKERLIGRASFVWWPPSRWRVIR